MTQNTQIQEIDYSALNEPVSDVDMLAYQQAAGVTSFFSVAKSVLNQSNINIKNKSWIPAVILIGIFVVITAVLSDGAALLGVFGFILMIAAFLYVCYLAVRYDDRKRAKLYKFTVQNNAGFIAKQANPGYAGMIFDEGENGSRFIDAACVFPGRAEIGNYRYTVGSGKRSTDYQWGYIRVKLPRKLPHMVLDGKKNNTLGFSNLSDAFNKEQKLSLEGDFDKHFTLYAPKEYERDALYIFTPDVMANLIDNGDAYDMEVISDELYIYSFIPFMLDSETVLRQQFSIVDSIANDLRDASDYYADERVGNRAQDSVAAGGVRLKPGVSGLKVFIRVAVVVMVLFQLAFSFPILWQLMNQ